MHWSLAVECVKPALRNKEPGPARIHSAPWALSYDFSKIEPAESKTRVAAGRAGVDSDLAGQPVHVQIRAPSKSSGDPG